MSTVVACLLILCLLPVICSGISGYYRKAQLGRIDNKNPRTQALALTGAGARAVAAQSNSWEALAVFSATMLAVLISGMDMAGLATLCTVFVGLRLVYIFFYIANIDALRSLSFIGGYGICLYIMYQALTSAGAA